jgi:DNA/RNA endonuclease YhcR with UshA esterase domain
MIAKGANTMCLLRMILIALSAFVAGVVVAHAAPPLRPDEAPGHVGEQATVCGLVASAAYTRSQTTFLNFDKPYPNHPFFAVIFKSDREKFVEKFGPPEKLQGRKDVCVTGKIQLYQGKPEIILNDPKQLETR